MKKTVSHWAFIALGAVIALWAAVSWFSPTVECRGEIMGPGDVCHYSSTGQVETDEIQTYEERVATARSQAPVGVVCGVGLVAFGGFLLHRDRHEKGRSPQASNDIGP